ncbi:MAG: metallophosphoesterase [Pseudomonadota bacterium]
MKIQLPEFSLVVFIDVSASVMLDIAAKHFLSSEILSFEIPKLPEGDSEHSQAHSKHAWQELLNVVRNRLKEGLLTVVNSPHRQSDHRKSLLSLAHQYHCPCTAIVIDTPQSIHQEPTAIGFGQSDDESTFRPHQSRLSCLESEGFRRIYTLPFTEEMNTLTIERQPLPNNKKLEHGPFDIIGDIHGCFDELLDLLLKLGYHVSLNNHQYILHHPDHRKIIFLGDLVDRGPKSPEVVRFVMDITQSGQGYCVAGNHDVKLVKALRGRDITLSHGLKESMEQFSLETSAFRDQTANFLEQLVSHYVLNEGKLVVAHAGLKEEMHGRDSNKVRYFSMYGETTGKTDAFGLPIRYNWAEAYKGEALVVYGHTPLQQAEWLNNTLCLDTGCVFGGALTALRYPEKEVVFVRARQQYFALVRPLGQLSDLLSPHDKLEKSLQHRYVVQ